MEISKVIIGILTLTLLLGLIPIVLGALLTVKMNIENSCLISFNYLAGMMTMLTIMQLYSVPMTLLQYTFDELVRAYSVTLVLLCLYVIIRHRRYLTEIWKSFVKRVQKADRRWFFIVLLIFVPAIVLAFYTPYIYGDDKTYLTMVNDIVESNTLYLIDTATGEAVTWVSAKYALSSYWTFLAYLVKVSGVHTLILCKTILIFVFTGVSYMMQGLVGSFLCKNSERKLLYYMFFLSIVQFFGCFSWYSTSFRLYTWIWQSKAFLAIIVIPFLFYACNIIFDKKMEIRNYALLLIGIITACSATLTGAGLALGMVLLLALMYTIRRKDWKILFGAGVTCVPAAIYMLLYLRYDIFVNWLRMQEVFRGIS